MLQNISTLIFDLDGTISRYSIGLRSIGVLWGFGDAEELAGAGADVIISDTSELGQLGLRPVEGMRR